MSSSSSDPSVSPTVSASASESPKPKTTPGASASNCITPGAVGVPLQNSSAWTATGCGQGFYCEHNNATFPPQYCPPTVECQSSRLSGQSCDPQGTFEPVVCQAGFYCPKEGGKIKCPAGSFCRIGSYEPSKCSPGSQCKEGAIRDMFFLPMGILIIIDLLLITAVIIAKIQSRYRTKHPKASKNKGLPFGGIPFGEKKKYQEIGDDSHPSAMEAGIPLQDNMEFQRPDFRRRPTGFEQLGLQGAEYALQDDLQDDNGASRTDLQDFVQSLSRILGATKFGLNFEFQNLRFQPKKNPKPILSEVTGMIDAGSLWGVMGASGAGKSTFVNVLMGKTPNTGGITKVNGVAGDIKKYKKIIGYVPQDDIVLPELTVRENILHSARVRLPASWSDGEIQNHVDILVRCLQLDHVMHSLVGSTSAPVISGGQRKRVSIGMELAAAPMALFLDEPTSGLDATAAASIMSTLKALSRLGMTIVTIIHQPRQEIFESLDSLVLLGKGRMIYTGPESGIQPYFEGLGFSFPDHSNPADIMGDIIAGEGRHYKPTGDAGVQGLIDYWASQHPSPTEADSKRSTVSVAEMNNLTKTIKQRGAPWYRQIWFCFHRSLVQQYRMKSSFFFELGVGAMAGFLIGLAEETQKGTNFRGIFNPPYSILSTSVDYSSVPQMALLVGLAIGLTASAPGVKIFGEEKLVYWREAAAGHNRFAYYVGKVVSTIPRMILANFHFTTMFMVLSAPRIPWFVAFAANLLYFWCIYGLASCVSMVTRREDGPLLAVMSSLIVGVLNGMSPSLKKVRGWHMAWLWRASPGTWLAEAYFTENVSPFRYLYQIDMAKESLGFHLGHYSRDLLLLLALGAIYRVVAFLGLRFMYPSKQR
ncbi:ABC transporter G family member [Lachnellula willkommii]|uniref:ABC transporter G family member n=1 Tax=Lachnellula willkommii TaxID=215461 RepID=A0A559MLX9_9HELO|nr:ABC transporter G family member [Lachnellula willkommii]